MKKYLFRDNHNGYEKTYHPFELDRSITQEEVNRLILSIIPSAGRVGSCIGHLLEGIDKLGWKFKQYKYSYYKPEENHSRCVHDKESWGIDPLPDCMYSWDVVDGISGNY